VLPLPLLPLPMLLLLLLLLLQVLVDAKSFDAAVADFNAALALAPAGMQACQELSSCYEQFYHYTVWQTHSSRLGTQHQLCQQFPAIL
jgi:hypothetical protein